MLTVDRIVPPLLILLLVALTLSITAADAASAVLLALMLLRLGDPAFRARCRWPLAASMGVFAVVTLVSAMTVGRGERSLALWHSKTLLALALFYVAVNGLRDGAGIRRALAWLFGALALVSVYAMLQSWACQSPAALPSWVEWALRVHFERCRAGIFRAKGFFSIYMTLAGSLLVALSLLLALLALGRWRRGALAAVAMPAIVALGLTYVRNAWLGLVVAIGLLLVLGGRLTLIALLAVLMAVGVSVSPVRARLFSMADPTDATARERLEFWAAGLRMVRDAPLLGLGPGGVKRHYPEYRNPTAKRERIGHLHNNLVQIAAERGLLGLGAWLWIWTAFFLKAGRTYRELPRSRADDRALVAGSLAAVAGFLLAGLFEYNFGDSEVIMLVAVVMAFPFVVAGPASVDGQPLASNQA